MGILALGGGRGKVALSTDLLPTWPNETRNSALWREVKSALLSSFLSKKGRTQFLGRMVDDETTVDVGRSDAHCYNDCVSFCHPRVLLFLPSGAPAALPGPALQLLRLSFSAAAQTGGGVDVRLLQVPVAWKNCSPV